jgi:hypothetical protein
MAFDPNDFLSNSSATATADFSPSDFLELQPENPDPKKDIGIVRAVKHAVQIPGAMIQAAQEAGERGGERTVVKNAQGQMVPRSRDGQKLNAVSTALNVGAAPFIALGNKGMQIANDVTANPWNGQGALEPFSDQNVMRTLGNIGVPVEKISQAMNAVKNKIGDEAYYNLSDIANIGANFVPALKGTALEANVAGSAIRNTSRAVGETMGKASDRFLSGELKIKQSLAKSAYGDNIIDKKMGILQTIKDHDLIMPTGNFEKATNKAQGIINNIESQRNALLDQIPDEFVPTDILKKTEKMGIPGAEGGVALGKSDQAQAIINGILADAKKAGLDQPTNAKGLMKIRKLLDPDGDMFDKGAFISKDDKLDDKIRKSMYFDILDAVEEKNTTVRELGREEKRLMDAKAILTDARSRIANRYPVSFADWATGFLGRDVGKLAAAAGVAEGAHWAGVPTPEAIMGAVSLYGLKKAGEQGRAAATLGKMSNMFNVFAGPKKQSRLPEQVNWFQSAPVDNTSPTLGNLGWLESVPSPITDKSRLLPPPMIPAEGQTLDMASNAYPTMRNRYESIGIRPQPQVERLALPAPMIQDQLNPVSLQRPVPTMRQRYESAGTTSRPMTIGEIGNTIADKLGVEFNGVQEGYGNIPSQLMFTDKKGTGSTFVATSPQEAQTKLVKMREMFQNSPDKKAYTTLGTLGGEPELKPTQAYQNKNINKATNIDPKTLKFRESEQNNTKYVKELFPGNEYFPAVTIKNKDGSREILDGHNRAKIAIERKHKLPIVDISKNEYDYLIKNGFDDQEIAYATLKRAGETEAADGINYKFPGADVEKRGNEAENWLEEYTSKKARQKK